MLSNRCEATNTNDEILETRFPYLEYPYPGLKSIKMKKGKRFIKTHLPFDLLPPSFTQSAAKVCGGCDVYIYFLLWYVFQLF